MSAPIADGDPVDLLHAHTQLRDAIISGRIAPGTRLSQAKLAAMFGFGRTPVREALRSLQHEGLVQIEPHRQLHVADFSVEDAEQIYFMRIVLEAAAVHATIPSLTRSDVAQMKGLLAQIDHFADEKDYSGADAEPHHQFHMKLIAGSGARIQRVLSEYADHSQRYRAAYIRWTPSSFETSQAEHRGILDAAAAGDAGGTAALLADHYARVASSVIGHLQAGYESALIATAAALARAHA